MDRTRPWLVASLLAAGLTIAGCAGTEPTEPAAAPVADPTGRPDDPQEDSATDAPAPAAAAADGTDEERQAADPAVEDATLGVQVHAEPDPKMGVNVRVETSGFAWAPEHASGDPVDGEGHAHLYVDGEKVGRLYGPDVHLGLEPGDHEIRVTLNGNDHRDLEVDGEVVEATTTVTVPEPATMGGHGPDGHEADPATTVSLEATPDAKMGLNVRIVTAGFAWAPEHASGDHVDGEGHAHLYVDGEKAGRVYGEWLHLLLDPGEHELRVTLNGNDHADYLVDGAPVEAVVTVTVPEPMTSGH